MGISRNKRFAALVDNEQVQRMLSLYQLSLTEETQAPRLGTDNQFSLAVYTPQHVQMTRLVVPTLDNLSQGLGYVNASGYEQIHTLAIPDGFKESLYSVALQEGKKEFERYVRQVRRELDKQGILLYCTRPIKFWTTGPDIGKIAPDAGKRPLSPMPKSVPIAQRTCTPERIRELAPDMAWLIPMLIVYRKIRMTEELVTIFDGWLEQLTPQQNEQLHTQLVRIAPYLVDAQVTHLLLHVWGRQLDKGGRES